MNFMDRMRVIAEMAQIVKENDNAEGSRDMLPHLEVMYTDEQLRHDCNIEAAFLEGLETHLAVYTALCIEFKTEAGAKILAAMPAEIRDEMPVTEAEPSGVFVVADAYQYLGEEEPPPSLQHDFETNLHSKVTEAINVTYAERNTFGRWTIAFTVMPYRFSDGGTLTWEQPMLHTSLDRVLSYPVAQAIARVVGRENVEAFDDLG